MLDSGLDEVITAPVVERVLPFRRVSEVAIDRAWDGCVSKPLEAWESPQYLAVIYLDKGFLRLSVNRISTNAAGGWNDGISWDSLQKIKSLIGYGSSWAVEVYPPDSEVVNVANMRHLFLLSEAPPFGWRKR